MKRYKNQSFHYNGELFLMEPNERPISEYEDRYNLLVLMREGSFMRIATVQNKKAARNFVRGRF